MLVGHDNILASLGSLLNVNRQLPTLAWNDTPPGGAMVFELRQKRNGDYVVRAYFQTQFLGQMHDSTVLNLDTPSGAKAPIYIPEASGKDGFFEAPLADFNKVADKEVILRYTNSSNTGCPMSRC